MTLKNILHIIFRLTTALVIVPGALCSPVVAQIPESQPLESTSGLRTLGLAEKIGYSEGDSAIVIPARVREIPAYCFAGCRGLKRVSFETGSQLRRSIC